MEGQKTNPPPPVAPESHMGTSWSNRRKSTLSNWLTFWSSNLCSRYLKVQLKHMQKLTHPSTIWNSKGLETSEMPTQRRGAERSMTVTQRYTTMRKKNKTGYLWAEAGLPGPISSTPQKYLQYAIIGKNQRENFKIYVNSIYRTLFLHIMPIE